MPLMKPPFGDEQLRVDLVDSGYRDSNDGEYPFLVSAQSLIGAGSSPNVEALRAPQDCPVEVNEIRFMFSNEDTAEYSVPPTNPTTGGNSLNLGGVIAAQFTLGQAPLTAGMVPIGALCHPSNLLLDGYHFHWKLPYPIYVPAGDLIQPAFSSNLDRVFGVRVSYVGRTAKNKRRPEKMKLPYVSAYRGPMITFAGTSSTVKSTERDLANGLSTPLNITHFVGRAYGFLATDSTSTYVDIPWMVDEITSATLVKMLRSDGFSCVKEYTPFYSVFFGSGRKFVCPHIMPPKTHYKVTLNNSALSFNISGLLMKVLPVIALHGWREVML